MELVKLKREHIGELDLRADQVMDIGFVNDDFLEMAENQSESYTGIEDGKPIFCYGLLTMWEGRALVWALMGTEAKKYAKSMHKAALFILDNSGFRRIEATIDPNSEVAIRWIEHLGFKYECTFKAYSPSGEDMLSYVRLN